MESVQLFTCISYDRYYILRERPSAGSRSDNIMEDIPMSESGEGALLGLPESETDLDVRQLHFTWHLLISLHKLFIVSIFAKLPEFD